MISFRGASSGVVEAVTSNDVRNRPDVTEEQTPMAARRINPPVDESARQTLAWLEAHGSASVVESMGPRYGIHTSHAFGVPMAQMKVLAKRLGKDHYLAARLWDCGWYEARMVASMVDDPAAVTPEQMDRWCHDFDNWAICDTVCFNLFDRTPHAWGKVDQWAESEHEFVKRTAFALLWSLALHDKRSNDERFVHGLSLIEREAHDDRNFVNKSVGMALRAIGRRNRTLSADAGAVAQRLTSSEHPAARRVGRTAIKELAQR
jgi:3-methyladenine DNA glycosylase AlkD